MEGRLRGTAGARTRRRALVARPCAFLSVLPDGSASGEPRVGSSCGAAPARQGRARAPRRGHPWRLSSRRLSAPSRCARRAPRVPVPGSSGVARKARGVIAWCTGAVKRPLAAPARRVGCARVSTVPVAGEPCSRGDRRRTHGCNSTQRQERERELAGESRGALTLLRLRTSRA